MSQHVTVLNREKTKYVYGWDPALNSFYLQVHDLKRVSDDQIVVWLGTAGTQLYTVMDLIGEARRQGLEIPHSRRLALVREQEDGR